MTTSSEPSSAKLPRGQLVFVCVLLLVGVGFLALAGYRAFNPPPAKAEPDLAQEAEKDLEKRGYEPLSESLERLLGDKAYKPIPTHAPRLLGERAPDFTLDDVDGSPWSPGKGEGPIVLVFYYGYTCNHCVSQLFGLNKDIEKFRELGARVVAVSPDTREKTKQQYAKYGAFDFPVLSDPGNKVAQLYGVFRPDPKGGDGDLMHGTFVIDRKGKIVWINAGDEPFTENRTLLVEIATAEGRPTSE